MKIAATYDNGQIWQHFGRTEYFKIYDVEDKKIISSEVISSDGAGHEALADFLAAKGVNLVICGGIGGGAKAALSEAGILIAAGAEGDADKAVEAFLSGEFVPSEGECHHHDGENGEEHHCGHHDHGEGGCCGHHHGEGGEGGCCGHHQPQIAPIGKNAGKTCKVHYRGTFNDGTQFDSSYDRGETLDFVCGAGMMIPGFDKAVAEMEVGQKINIHLMPEEAYGPSNPNMILTVDVSQMPGSEDLQVGQQVYLSTTTGQPVAATVTRREGTSITFDANHEMAGKELNFEIELIELV